MPFSAPSPPGSTTSDFSSRNSANSSPRPDLELDPSDPLNLLLVNSQSSDSSMDDSSSGGSPPDWSQISALSALWASSSPLDAGSESNTKGYSDTLDYNMLASEFDDFTAQMAIDPHALHFDPHKFGLDEFSLTNDLTPNQYSFSFQPDMDISQPFGRRLSVTSSSSSSGASLSSVIESQSSPSHLAAPESIPAPSLHSAAEELAQRVRQSAGVMHALPMGMQQPNEAALNFLTLAGQNSGGVASAFTALQPASPPTSGSSVSSAPSTPPPTTPSSDPINTNVAMNTCVPDMNTYMSAGGSMGMISRPKTSHTTIERRYRTNLNARIMSLRMAVPALRVLKDKEGCGVGGGGKKTKGKNATLGDVVFGSTVKKEGEDGDDVVDVIDERGFVDGVKVARKCSKANVLGKAVEYIRVLKKRENRLKREQDGLKALVSGLVGGSALLREWEREWKENFGGEEKDEVEGEEMDDGGSDDEGGGSGDDDDADDEGARKRKKPKLAPVKKEPKEKRPPPPPLQPIVLPDGSVMVPEKRKRGRPRKVVPPVTAAVVEPPVLVQSVPVAQSQHQSQHAQYLLATFALFSFFNSPFSSSSSSSPSHPPPNHTHTGTVLAHGLPSVAHGHPAGWTWHDVIQAFHLLVSILVFSSILAPWFPSLFKTLSAKYVSLKQSASRPPTAPRLSRSRSASLIAALSASNRGTEHEAIDLRNALDSHHSVFSTVKVTNGKSKENIGFEQTGLEQRAWVRLGEISVLGGKTSLLDRVLTCWHMRSHLPWFTASAADLSTLALAMWPLGRCAHHHARSVWEAARARKGFSGIREGGVGVQVRPHERLVLESITLDEAITRLKSPAATQVKETEWNRYSPIGVLACMLVKERVKNHLELLFVKTVLPEDRCYELEDGAVAAIHNAAEDNEEEERRKTIEAARSLGGKMAELGDTLHKMWTMGVWELDDISIASHDDEEKENGHDLDTEIRVLLKTLVLYRQIFSSSILGSIQNGHSSGVSILLSPPPSPIRQDMKLHYALRRMLGSTVFDSDNGLGGVIEDARDQLVDMLVECERAGRST